jgi:hypothetical protein
VMPFAARGATLREPPSRPQIYAAAAVAVLVLASLVSAQRLLQRDPAALASHGRALLTMQVSSGSLNDLAWRMVTESEPNEEGISVATDLAQRAVEQTERRDPNILDTLAEVLFVAGDDQGAIHVIDEAIELTGSEVYFLEQRRRFLGERARDDRPDPPTNLIIPVPEMDEVFPDDPGISI